MDWFPEAAKAGVRYIAMIRPQKFISQMSVKRVTSRVSELEIETDYFDFIDQAREWLGNKI